MGDDANPVDEAENYRWRPAVAPFRRGVLPRIRPRKPLAGQMSLPGMESLEEPPPTGRLGRDESHRVDAPESPGDDSAADARRPRLACPNCGGAEFDEDGDCVRCWEPGVASGDGPPEADE